MRRLLSCHDPRLEQDTIASRLGVAKDTVKKLLQRLREGTAKRRIIAIHLRLIEALGFKSALVELEAPDARELLRRLRPFRGPIRPYMLEDIVPLPRLLASVVKIEDGPLYATYRLPQGLEEEVLAVLGSDERLHAIIDPGLRSAPVRGCLPPEEAHEAFERLLATRLRDVYPVADLALMGIFDANPLARLRPGDMDPDAVAIVRIGSSLGVSGLYKALASRYRSLSRRGLLGRVYYVKPSDLLRSKSIVVGGPDAAAEIYTAAVETMGAAYVARGEEVSIATASADADRFHRIASGYGTVRYEVAYAAFAPPPLELYDCSRRGFSLEPLPSSAIAECLREEALRLAGRRKD